MKVSKKIAEIKGEIPPIDSEKVEKVDFHENSRKIFPYEALKRASSAYNGKISA
ncbi:hypothetical protein QMK38_07035 [Lysinibacillus fusiformis]|nr:hypothetical protein [Lysinibacillus fusiformis]